MEFKVFVFTPPFTQLNTPYPASAYIKGFLNTKNIFCTQADLGLEVLLELFSSKGLSSIFDSENFASKKMSSNSQRILALKQNYINTIHPVVEFLQGKNPNLALSIVQDNFLPQAARFNNLQDIDWAFGSMGIQDKAKHLATLYLEDLSDFIIENIDSHFGFSRYAEKLGRSAYSFDNLYQQLQKPTALIENILLELLANKMNEINPNLVLISVPFPGNLFAAFRCGQYLKQNYPNVKIAMGGGFPNTELRELSDARVFEFIDYITLDDGELPVEEIIKTIQNPNRNTYKRTFLLQNNKVVYLNNSTQKDYSQKEVGTPDYSDLPLPNYLSVIEMLNPMHKLWSDGRWNKLTLAHGCYWGKCTFCDISLDYIKIYEPVAANLICDRIEELIQQNGQRGFHFVDEAAPPSLLKELALEILRRKLIITWWTNIRFEKSFSLDLCNLLKTAGCVAVSGGLEVASDRLLQLIDKGVSVAQVAKVTQNFTQSGIMVHAYLMYGYPTQTVQETVDSLEMVRQLFENGILQSAFWHQFALTIHSPIAKNPDKFGIKILPNQQQGFALNDLIYKDKTGINHSQFSFGLKKSLFNFMQEIGLDFPLQSWFEFKIPKTTVPKNYIYQSLIQAQTAELKPSNKVYFLGELPHFNETEIKKKGEITLGLKFNFYTKSNSFKLILPQLEGNLLIELLKNAQLSNKKPLTIEQIQQNCSKWGLNFNVFWFSSAIQTLKQEGLLISI